MSILDDPTLALIARFVVNDIDNISLPEEIFLKNQLAEIGELIENVPEEQQQDVILNWICEHAEQYRNQWRRGVISRLLLNKRCTDCPLLHNGTEGHCVIHNSWVKLLNDYVSSTISSDTYIHDTLQLLQTQKTNLKVSSLHSKIQPSG